MDGIYVVGVIGIIISIAACRRLDAEGPHHESGGPVVQPAHDFAEGVLICGVE